MPRPGTPGPFLRQYCLCILAFAACAGPALAQTTTDSYQVVHGWPHLPDGITLGQVCGVGIDSHNRVYAFRRGENSLLEDISKLPTLKSPAIMIFDGATGDLVASWGGNTFVRPHGLTIDRHDNIWLTDIGTHQIYKYTSDGKLLLTLGERGKPGDDHSHFNRPTDVAVAPDGSFYVSDGYGNSRIVKFTPEGHYLFEWGTKGDAPGQFDTPHSIALDAAGNVYVADRANARVQIFDPAGKYLRQWKSPELGRPWAVRLGADGFFYVIDGGDMPKDSPGRARIFKLDPAGRIVAAFGRYGNYDGQFIWPHDIAIGADGALYIGDVSTGMRLQKFIPHPSK